MPAHNYSNRRQTYKVERIEQLEDTLVMELNMINENILKKCDAFVMLEGKLDGNDINLELKPSLYRIENPGGDRINELGGFLRGKIANIIRNIKPEEIFELIIKFNVIYAPPASASLSVRFKGNLIIKSKPNIPASIS